MTCPKCENDVAAPLPDGRYQCSAEVVIDVVPAGMGGNVGAAGRPIYGPCQRVFTSAESAAAAARVAERLAAVQAKEEQRRERAAVARDPRTLERIAELAAFLIERRPEGSVPVVFEVRVPGRKRRKDPSVLRAEVYRSWPVGSFGWSNDEVISAYNEFAVAADGGMSIVTGREPNVHLTEEMEWDPIVPVFQLRAGWQTEVLERLQRDAGEVATGAPIPPRVFAPVVLEHQMTRREKAKIAKLRTKATKISGEGLRLREIYGDPEESRPSGPPDRDRERAWSQMERLSARLREITAQIARIERGE